MSDAPPEAPVPDSEPRQSKDSLLDSIGRRAGRVLGTSLHDTEGDETSPILDPRVESYQDQLRGEDRGKYRVVGEIASGGMGVVLRGHDSELGRDVAMKVVHAELADRPEVIERFVEEAQIGGQLQHPGIVPVYELGLMADQRPFFTMKLIKGHTLAKLLMRRKAVDEDRVRFLSIFESVCQTMAYAHSKGVIHRDLKPANVMVGSFGEVQVVDWGLSKVMRSGGVADEIASREGALSVIETVRSGPKSGSDSLAGNVLGTPAYMAPEQARGAVEQLDERSDVFALGAILCELLTGAPPYVQSEGKHLVQMAALAELDDALERIEESQASEELKRLCRACLMPAKNARPSSAEEVAETIHAHIAGLESAAHEAQLEAANERLTAERTRRRLQLTLSIGALVLVGGGGWVWTDAERRERMTGITDGFEDARTEALGHLRSGAYAGAVEAARGGLRLVETGGADSALKRRAAGLVASMEESLAAEVVRLATAERDRKLLAFLTDVAMRQVDTGIVESDEDIDAEYRAALGEFGLDLDDPNLGDVTESLRDTEMGVRLALGADGWARVMERVRGDRSDQIDLLNSIALDLDPDPIRTEVRLAAMEEDEDALLALAREARLEAVDPETLVLLASRLNRTGALVEARSILTHGADRHADHFLLNFLAARSLDGERGENHRYGRMEGYLRAAHAVRPDLAEVYLKLGDFYRSVGNRVLAARWAERVVEIAPEHTWNGDVLATDYLLLGDFEAAIVWYEREKELGYLDASGESRLRACRVARGESTREEYVAWTGTVASQGPSAWIGPAFSYLNLEGDAAGADPERALEILQPFVDADLDVVPGWICVAHARLLLGEGQGALEAVQRVERLNEPQDMYGRCETALLGAAAHRMVGDDAEADLKLRRSRRLLEELTAGYEQEWAQSGLVKQFAVFGPMAAGR